MVSCLRCGRVLTNPKSINRQLGPVCAKKVESKSLEITKALVPENLELERQVMKFLLDNKIELHGVSEKRLARKIRKKIKLGFHTVKDFSYHNFEKMYEYIKTHNSDFIVYMTDLASYDDPTKSLLIITLLEKTKKIPLTDFMESEVRIKGDINAGEGLNDEGLQVKIKFPENSKSIEKIQDEQKSVSIHKPSDRELALQMDWTYGELPIKIDRL